MKAEDVRAIVEREIAGDWTRMTGHGCDLRRCLVSPVRMRYEDPMQKGWIEIWLVLEELPVERNGYKIVYDEGRGYFGLACPGFAGHEVSIGWYGSFLETYEAM